jgi:REP element-mobilizing transposase RayT
MEHQLFHCINRGVEKRNIVTTKADCLRFASSLVELNTTKRAYHTERTHKMTVLRVRSSCEEKCVLVADTESEDGNEDDGEPLVYIHAWCLMKNHYHLLLSDAIENGISRFLQKFNAGYTHYFNIRNERKGVLFQGKTKKVPVLDDNHLFYVPHYIHANPLDTKKETYMWREYGLKNVSDVEIFLDTYPWSSYGAYMHDAPDSITYTAYIKELFDEDGHTYKSRFLSFLTQRKGDEFFPEKEFE